MTRGVAVLLLILVLLAFSITSCGGYNNPSSTQPSTSNLAKRVFVSDNLDGTLHIIDAAKDAQTGFRIAVTGAPGSIALSASKKFTLVVSPTVNVLSVVKNSTEQSIGSTTLPDFSDSFVMLSDDKTGFAAVRNSNVVQVLDLSGFGAATSITVPLARRLALSHNGSKLLVFSDGPNLCTQTTDCLTVIDTSTKTPTSVAGFDRPVWGVFSTDDSKAYIMNCGPECGGTAASVAVLDMTQLTVTNTIPVSAATMGLLNGTTLFVAGSPPGAACDSSTTATSCGRLDVVDTQALSVTTSGLVITDGYHDRMELGNNNKVFIGARTCTNVSTSTEVRGCLTIFDPNGSKVIVPPANGDVTGIAPISGRNVVYVIQQTHNGVGELQIYDTTTNALQSTQFDISGSVVDVKDIE